MEENTVDIKRPRWQLSLSHTLIATAGTGLSFALIRKSDVGILPGLVMLIATLGFVGYPGDTRKRLFGAAGAAALVVAAIIMCGVAAALTWVAVMWMFGGITAK